MTTKILLIGVPLSGNFGGPSLLSSTTNLLGKVIPDAKFVYLSRMPNDVKFSKTYKVKIVSYTLKSLLSCLLEAFLSRIKVKMFTFSHKLLTEFQTADIVIDIRGISFADPLCKGFLSPASMGIHFLIGKLLQKTVIKYTADMGPFDNLWNRFFAKFYLNKIDLILARSEKTKKYLYALGITTPIYTCPDTAFLLKPINCSEVVLCTRKMRKRTIVGISLSHVAEQIGGERYVILMAKLADYLIKKLDALILLIPNEIFPQKKSDDLRVAEKVFKKINAKNNVMLLTFKINAKHYSANKLKGIIKKCDLFIGARYHSIVAATSMCIPTLAISWHHKYYEVMKLLGQEEYVCDVRSLNFLELQKKVTKLWKSRKKIKNEIKSCIPFLKRRIIFAGTLVKYFKKSNFRSSLQDFIQKGHQISADNSVQI